MSDSRTVSFNLKYADDRRLLEVLESAREAPAAWAWEVEALDKLIEAIKRTDQVAANLRLRANCAQQSEVVPHV